ncbi:hypothetical protein MRX96_054617 [Rhipicephalus microplus]
MAAMLLFSFSSSRTLRYALLLLAVRVELFMFWLLANARASSFEDEVAWQGCWMNRKGRRQRPDSGNNERVLDQFGSTSKHSKGWAGRRAWKKMAGGREGGSLE